MRSIDPTARQDRVQVARTNLVERCTQELVDKSSRWLYVGDSFHPRSRFAMCFLTGGLRKSNLGSRTGTPFSNRLKLLNMKNCKVNKMSTSTRIGQDSSVCAEASASN